MHGKPADITVTFSNGNWVTEQRDGRQCASDGSAMMAAYKLAELLHPGASVQMARRIGVNVITFRVLLPGDDLADSEGGEP